MNTCAEVRKCARIGPLLSTDRASKSYHSIAQCRPARPGMEHGRTRRRSTRLTRVSITHRHCSPTLRARGRGEKGVKSREKQQLGGRGRLTLEPSYSGTRNTMFWVMTRRASHSRCIADSTAGTGTGAQGEQVGPGRRTNGLQRRVLPWTTQAAGRCLHALDTPRHRRVGLLQRQLATHQ